MDILDRLQRLEDRAIQCTCECAGSGGPHECSCIPNVKHRHDKFQTAGNAMCCYEYFSGSCPMCGMTHLCRKPQPPPENKEPFDIRLETELHYLRKENVRLYEALKQATQPPPEPYSETCKKHMITDCQTCKTPEPCEMKRCDGSCMSGQRCAVCHRKQAHCSCYEFKPAKPEKCGCDQYPAPHDGPCRPEKWAFKMGDSLYGVERDVVEAKIEEISESYASIRTNGWPVLPWIQKEMRKLVELARR